MIAIARKHRAAFTADVDKVKDSAKGAFGAATSSAGNEFAKATDSAQLKAEHAFDSVVGAWSNVCYHRTDLVRVIYADM